MSEQKLLHFFAILLLVAVSNSQICHYTCLTCSGPEYYQCTACPANRGNSGAPFAGMCYCSDDNDQNDIGLCSNTDQYNHNNKTLILSFIGLSVTLAIITTIIRGSKYFLLKIIEDVQELSLIVFINLYFPQQFDPFLVRLYRFNISSYTFQAMTKGSLFQVDPNNGVQSLNGSNIHGKYKLLYKTSNFFSNQFTWMIVFTCIFVFMICLRFATKYLVQKDAKSKIQIIKNESQINLDQEGNEQVQQTKVIQVKQQDRNWKQLSIKNILIKFNNILWLNFIIFFFYFSLIEININIFGQISNLTFSSKFAATGAFFSAIFLGLQIALIALLVLKSKQEMIKPTWMRDHTYTAPIYLIRTNYKTLTKYFFFFSCLKKVLLAMMITVLYENPVGSIIGLSSVELAYLCFAMYCQPFERRYMRIHFYFTEGLKFFMYVSLINFTQKYVQYIHLIDITKILFLMLTFIFGFHFVAIILNILIEKDVYWYQIKRKLKMIGLCKGWLQYRGKQGKQKRSQNQQKCQKSQKQQEKQIRSQRQNESIVQQNLIGYISENTIYLYKNEQDFYDQSQELKKQQSKRQKLSLAQLQPIK